MKALAHQTVFLLVGDKPVIILYLLINTLNGEPMLKPATTTSANFDSVSQAKLGTQVRPMTSQVEGMNLMTTPPSRTGKVRILYPAVPHPTVEDCRIVPSRKISQAALLVESQYRSLSIGILEQRADNVGFERGYSEGYEAAKKEMVVLIRQAEEHGFDQGYKLAEAENKYEVETIDIDAMLDEMEKRGAGL